MSEDNTLLDGRYRVIEKLAVGGMGTVYLAEQINIKRRVAIKVLHPEVSDDPDIVARFQSEAKIISELAHPNTIKLFDYGRADDGTLYLVTEYLDGEPLSRAIRSGPLAPRRVLDIVRSVCLSLEEAHQRGVIHRDLKPANIFLIRVGDQEIVKVLDFGIAKVGVEGAFETGEDGPLTAKGIIMGTPAYMSPEMVDGRPVEPGSDIYSLGIVAYECLVGHPPFRGSPIQQIAAHGMEEPPPFSTTAPMQDIDPRVESLVQDMLQKRAENRPLRAADVARRIETLFDTPVPPRTKTGGSSAPMIIAFLASAILGAAVVAGLLWMPPKIDGADASPDDVPTGVEADAAGSIEDVSAGLTTLDAAAIDTAAPDSGVLSSGDVLLRSRRIELIVETNRGFAGPITESVRGRLRGVIAECYETTQSRTDPAQLTIQFSTGRAGASMSVVPSTANADRFRRCVALRLPAQLDWPRTAGGQGEFAIKARARELR